MIDLIIHFIKSSKRLLKLAKNKNNNYLIIDSNKDIELNKNIILKDR